MDELRRHPGLLEQLERARGLGFLGPGPVEAHIDHAGAFLTALEDTSGAVVDLGSGGGVPGLILAVARADLRMVLLDARVKRCEFLEVAAQALAVDVVVAEGRAEVLGRSSLRGSAQAVVARSFGLPATTAECGSPLLAVGGRLVVSEPPPPVQPGRWPEDGVRRLGLEVSTRVEAATTVQVLIQRTACPDAFPRRDGLPSQRPLF